ncbi:hypothetical protein AAC387_Pa12g0372 [Persea americana]
MGFSPSLPGQPFLLPPHHRPAFLNQPPPSLSQSPKLLPQSTPFIPPAILPPPLIPPAILPAPPNSALPVGPQEGPFCALRPPPSAPNPSWHFPPLPSQPAGLLATGQSSGQLPVVALDGACCSIELQLITTCSALASPYLQDAVSATMVLTRSVISSSPVH